ncbi:MAG: hypothetical protein ACOCSD_05110 [Halolamina sp.]
MRVTRSAEKVWGDPFGRLVTLLVGVGLVFGSLTLFPRMLPVAEWAVPAGLVLWGAFRFYRFGVDDPLTAAAACLLVLGGFALAAARLVPMGGLTGTLAHLVPTVGILVELFANHYRERTDLGNRE